MVCHVVRVPVILLGVTGMDNLSDAQIFHDLLGLIIVILDALPPCGLL